MRIFVPFTKLRSATYLAAPRGTEFVPLLDQFDYARYFRQRWDVGETFINIEHDVVAGAKVLESLWACPGPVCVTGYVYPDSPADFQPEITYLGCVKISAEFIADTSDLWRDLPAWNGCDGRITQAIERKPYPGVNGNDLHCCHGKVTHLHYV